MLSLDHQSCSVCRLVVQGEALAPCPRKTWFSVLYHTWCSRWSNAVSVCQTWVWDLIC